MASVRNRGGVTRWNPSDRPYSISEVARLFNVTVQAVHLWMKTGRLRRPARSSKKGRYQVPRKELVRLLESKGVEVPGLWQRRSGRVLVIDPDPGIVEGYSVFRRIAKDPPPGPLHLEFLIDIQGYLRARWTPGESPGWKSIPDLLHLTDALKREKPRAPALARHAH